MNIKIDNSPIKKNSKKHNFKLYFILYSIIIIIFVYKSKQKKIIFKKEELNIKLNNISFDNKNLTMIDKVQDFLFINDNELLINDKKTFKKKDFPKISITISVYNGELFIKKAIRSIQNQNFQDIEIILVDDYSQDNSVSIIRELMKEDPRIILLQNKQNKGALYTKVRGILNSKGKYVMSLDVDDMYADKNAFSFLYKIAEKNDLDILGFGSIISTINITKNYGIYRYFSTQVLHQPNISSMMFFKKGEKVKRNFSVIWCYMFKTVFFKSIIIEEIEEKYLNRIMNVHDDILLLFILLRKAESFMCIKKVFHFYRRKTLSPSINLYIENKNQRAKKYNCLSYLYYLEFLLFKTDNNYIDKIIASSELNTWYLNNKKCNSNNNIINQGIYICIIKIFFFNE